MHNHSAEDLFINNKQKIKIFTMLLRALGKAESAMDIMYATPLRNWQIFGEESFNAIADISKNAILSPLTVVLSIVGALPFIAKLFVKDHVNNLGEMLNHLENEFNVKFNVNSTETHDNLIARFNDFLKKRGLFYLQADLVTKKVGIINKKYKHSLKFKYIDPMIEFFHIHWFAVKDKSMFNVVQHILQDANSTLATDIEPGIVPERKNQDPLTTLYASQQPSLSIKKEKNTNVEFIQQIFLSQKNHSLTQQDVLTLFNQLKQDATLVSSILDSPQFTKKQKNSIILLSRLYGFFIDQNGELCEDLTLETTRKQFIEKINAVSVSQVIGNGYDTINDFTFNFWLSFFCNDVLDGRADSSLWDRRDQIIVLAVAGGIALVQASFKLINYFSNKEDAEKAPLSIYYSNKTLKHQLLEEFFIEEVSKKQLKEANKTIHQYPVQLTTIYHQKKIEDILAVNESDHSTKVSKQFALLKDTYDPNQSKLGKRATTALTNAMTQGILISFMGWVFGAILLAAGTALAAGVVLSTPVGLELFAAGMIMGATWFADRQITKDKQIEAERQTQIENNLPKIHKLEVLENQNKQLRGLLKEENIPRLTVAKAQDDRLFRRLTTEKSGILSTLAKTLSHLFLGGEKMGGGILIMRLTVLPILGLIGAFSNPVGLGIALGFGIAWSIFHVVKYHQEQQLAKSQRTLDDIDNRIIAEQKNQEIYLKQLRHIPLKVKKQNDATMFPLSSIKTEAVGENLQKTAAGKITPTKPIKMWEQNRSFSLSHDKNAPYSTAHTYKPIKSM